MGIKPSSLRSPWSSPRAATKPAHPAATEAGGGTSVRLPRDVVFDILSWVPVKSACRFKSVCREWRAVISDPAFVAAHRARAEPLLAVAANSCDEPWALRLMDMDGNTIKVIKNTDSILRFVCSSPGNLMCVVGYSLGKAKVLNLATGEATVIYLKFSFMGFGRAAPSGIYKIVCISPSSTEILTVGDGVGWRLTQPLPNSISYNSRPVVVRGAMYLMLALMWIHIRGRVLSIAYIPHLKTPYARLQDYKEDSDWKKQSLRFTRHPFHSEDSTSTRQDMFHSTTEDLKSL